MTVKRRRRRECRAGIHPSGFGASGRTGPRLYAGSDYLAQANEEIICLVMVENINTIPEPGGDGQGHRGLTGSTSGRRIWLYRWGSIRGTTGRAKSTGMLLKKCWTWLGRTVFVAGTHCGSPEEAKERFEQGFVMCPVMSDAGLLASAARNALERAKTPEVDAAKPFY